MQLVTKVYIYVNRFPKAQKFVLGQRIENAAMEFVMLIIETNNTPIKDRQKLFKKMSLILEKIRVCLRTSNQLSFLSTKGYEILSGDLMELTKMLKGWEKTCLNQ